MENSLSEFETKKLNALIEREGCVDVVYYKYNNKTTFLPVLFKKSNNAIYVDICDMLDDFNVKQWFQETFPEVMIRQEEPEEYLINMLEYMEVVTQSQHDFKGKIEEDFSRIADSMLKCIVAGKAQIEIKIKKMKND